MDTTLFLQLSAPCVHASTELQGYDAERVIYVYGCNTATCYGADEDDSKGPASKTNTSNNSNRATSGSHTGTTPTWGAFVLNRLTLATPAEEEEEEEIPSNSTESTSAFASSTTFNVSFGSSDGGFGDEDGDDDGDAFGGEGDEDDLEALLKLRDVQLSEQPDTFAATATTASASASAPASKADSVVEEKEKTNVQSESQPRKKLGALPWVEIDFDNEPGDSKTTPSKSKSHKQQQQDGSGEEAWGQESYEPSNVQHKAFYRFQKRLLRSPEQIIRYHRGGEPLLPSDDSIVSSPSWKPPACEVCGGARVFELQLMPSFPYLINQYHDGEGNDDDVEDEGEDGLCRAEFGTILVYSCTKDCLPTPPTSTSRVRTEYTVFIPAE
jgi:hypothetical protein